MRRLCAKGQLRVKGHLGVDGGISVARFVCAGHCVVVEVILLLCLCLQASSVLS